MIKSNAILVVILLLAAPTALAQNRIHFNGQYLFLSGANLAWQNFANDIGPNPSTPDTNHFADVFNQIHANGGNSLRLWLHTTGAYTPAWSGSLVTGPGSDTITDLQTILDLAWERKVGVILCLWSFDMLRMSNGSTITTRARNILTNDVYRQAYITNCLVPMVQALQGHPAIIAWEIFNEPEGMSDEFGWDFNYHVPMADIQTFINQCAGAIHRADPNAKVTNGSWSFYATTDAGSGNYNYYTDDRLYAAGGDPDGHLDFYTVHYYDWAGTERSPFQHPCSYWALTKPLVVAEFFPDPPDCVNCGTTSYETLYQNGYAGALAWSWTDSDPNAMLAHMAAVSSAHPADVLIVDPGTPTVAITSPANGSTFDEDETVPITADAADADGSIAKVEFFAGTSKLGEDTTSPYSFDWVSPPAGQHQLSAVATDNSGFSNRSAYVNITVGTPPTPTRYEAEDAALTGDVTVGSDGAASEGAYADMKNTGTITWTVINVPAAANYSLTFGYKLAYDTPKSQYLLVNGGAQSTVAFDGAIGTWLQKTVSVALVAGSNQIQIQKYWGWMYFDYIELPQIQANTAPTLASIPEQTINPGVTLTITNVASDAQSPPQTLTFSLLTAPAGASLDTSSGVFSWRAPVSAAGTTNLVAVRVTDNGSPSLSATNSYHVTVNPLTPVMLGTVAVGAGQLSFSVEGPLGPDYTVLSSTNLTDWQTVFTTNAPGTITLTSPSTAPALFYRIQLGP